MVIGSLRCGKISPDSNAFGYSFSLFSEDAFPVSEKYSMQCIDGEGNDVAGEIEVIEDGYNSLIRDIQ